MDCYERDAGLVRVRVPSPGTTREPLLTAFPSCLPLFPTISLLCRLPPVGPQKTPGFSAGNQHNMRRICGVSGLAPDSPPRFLSATAFVPFSSCNFRVFLSDRKTVNGGQLWKSVKMVLVLGIPREPETKPAGVCVRGLPLLASGLLRGRVTPLRVVLAGIPEL
jgi:hypothetical protein